MPLNGKLRLAYVVSHPIQYQAPLLRRLAREPDINLSVFFWADFSTKEYADEGFGGTLVKWDVPLLEGYKYQYLPTIRSSSEGGTFWAPINRGIFRELKKGRFDAVWLHGYWNVNCLLTMVAAKILGIPLLERAESTLTSRSRSVVRRSTKRVFFAITKYFIDAVLPIGRRNREYWNHYLGPDFPSFMVPYAVDNLYFQARTTTAGHSREEFRKELGLEEGMPVILYASKLTKGKRCIDLIDAYVSMKPMHDGKKPYLLIVGDGRERASCEARVRASGESRVRFLGFQNQSQLPRFYDLCDLFVLPSQCETFGLVVNELMNASRPVVVSDGVGCQPDLVTDGVNGKVFPVGNVPLLRNILEGILDDLAACDAMGSRGLERIDHWSFEEDIRGLREALNYVAGLPLCPDQPVIRDRPGSRNFADLAESM